MYHPSEPEDVARGGRGLGLLFISVCGSGLPHLLNDGRLATDGGGRSIRRVPRRRRLAAESHAGKEQEESGGDRRRPAEGSPPGALGPEKVPHLQGPHDAFLEQIARSEL